MKNLTLILLLFAVSFCSAQEKTKKISTVTFTVKGNCEQCKDRIENAADLKGVKLAQWDSKTQKLKITFREDKVSEKEIKDAILKSGHDVNDEKAPEQVYNKLPDCCKYRDKKCSR
jgi:periplasmic mercuric ion binding protein